MRILFVNTLYFPNMVGGAERSVQSLAESLVCLGHTVFVVCIGKEKKVDVVNGVNVHYLKLSNIYWPFGESHSSASKMVWYSFDLYNIVMAKTIGNILGEIHPDIVHTNNLLGFSVSVWSEAKKHKIPVVHTMRDMYLLCVRSTMFRSGKVCKSQCMSCSLYSSLKKESTKYVDHVVGISRFILNTHQAFKYFSDIPSSVIYNGYKPASVSGINNRRSFVFGFLGSIIPTKGIDLLIEIYLSSRASSNTELIIAGEGHGSYFNEITKKTKGSSIRLVGRVRPSEFFDEIDVLVVPSIWPEPLGRIIIESYAHGVPVIVSNRGGAPEIVEQGITGYIFEPDMPSTLTIALERFSNNRELARNMTSDCLKKAKQFLPEILAGQYLEIYQKLCSLET